MGGGGDLLVTRPVLYRRSYWRTDCLYSGRVPIGGLMKYGSTSLISGQAHLDQVSLERREIEPENAE